MLYGARETVMINDESKLAKVLVAFAIYMNLDVAVVWNAMIKIKTIAGAERPHMATCSVEACMVPGRRHAVRVVIKGEVFVLCPFCGQWTNKAEEIISPPAEPAPHPTCKKEGCDRPVHVTKAGIFHAHNICSVCAGIKHPVEYNRGDDCHPEGGSL